MGKKHALLSASGSAKWMNCPGSIAAEKPYPNESNAYAQEGTLAHKLFEICLRKGVDSIDCAGKKIAGNIINKEMATHTQEFIDYVRSFEDVDTEMLVEQEVDFSHIAPEGFGTVDVAVIVPSTRTCHVIDFKYGAGVAVSAEENTQGLMYALGMLRLIDEAGGDVSYFHIHIVQPRIPKGDKITEWAISTADLIEFGKQAKQKALLALSDDAPRIAGNKQCRWCRAKPDCRAHKEYLENIVIGRFEDIDKEADSELLTLEEKAAIIAHKDEILQFLKVLEEDGYSRLENGLPFPGFKLVEATTNRRFKKGAEDDLTLVLGDDAYKRSLIGIGDAKSKLTKLDMDCLTEKPDGRPVMVKLEDKRPALMKIDVKTRFENLDEEDDL